MKLEPQILCNKFSMALKLHKKLILILVHK